MGGGRIDLASPCGFSKEKGWSSAFLDVNIILSHIVSENFIEIPQVVQNI